jgi:acetyl-CoA synthetase
MSEYKEFAPAKEVAANAHIDKSGYEVSYAQSLADNDAFWAEHGKRINWIKPYSKISDVSYDKPDVHIKWFEDGTLNASANCLDRHLASRGDQTAIIWEGDEPDTAKHITYKELHEQVCRFANALKARGIKKGDHLYAHGSRGSRCDARLHTGWRYPFGCVWWLFPRRASRTHTRLRLKLCNYRR